MGLLVSCACAEGRSAHRFVVISSSFFAFALAKQIWRISIGGCGGARVDSVSAVNLEVYYGSRCESSERTCIGGEVFKDILCSDMFCVNVTVIRNRLWAHILC